MNVQTLQVELQTVTVRITKLERVVEELRVALRNLVNTQRLAAKRG